MELINESYGKDAASIIHSYVIIPEEEVKKNYENLMRHFRMVMSSSGFDHNYAEGDFEEYTAEEITTQIKELFEFLWNSVRMVNRFSKGEFNHLLKDVSLTNDFIRLKRNIAKFQFGDYDTVKPTADGRTKRIVKLRKNHGFFGDLFFGGIEY